MPPLRLVERGVEREDLLNMLAVNVRHPRDFRGDLAAQVGSVKLGERRLHALLAELGGETVATSIDVALAATERRVREAIGQWRDGTYTGTAYLDDDGRGREDIAIRATVTVAGDALTVDLTESDAQVASFLNSSYANMRSAVAMALSFLLDADVAKNDGAMRPVTIRARQGTVVWANEGAPVAMSTSHCAQEIIEAIVVALADACPERTMAGWGRRLRIALKGVDPRNGRPFIWHMFHARPGAGASAGGDGWHGVGEWHSAGGLKFGSVEVAESRFPLFFKSHEFRPNSGGAGRFAGGVGATLELVLETEEPAVANTAGEGVRHGARGLLGGADGATHRYRMRAPGARAKTLGGKMEGLSVPAGTTFLIESGGGGGWGDPALRTPDAVRADRRDGLSTRRKP